MPGFSVVRSFVVQFLSVSVMVSICSAAWIRSKAPGRKHSELCGSSLRRSTGIALLGFHGPCLRRDHLLFHFPVEEVVPGIGVLRGGLVGCW